MLDTTALGRIVNLPVVVLPDYPNGEPGPRAAGMPGRFYGCAYGTLQLPTTQRSGLARARDRSAMRRGPSVPTMPFPQWPAGLG